MSFYQDDRIQGWRDNYIYQLPSGELVAIYDDVTERKQAEHALKASEANLKAFFDNSPIGINVFDRDGKVLVVNRAAREMFGVSLTDPLKNYCLFDDPAILPETKAALRGGQSAEVAERLRAVVAKTKIPLESGLPLQFTVCIGIASLKDKDTNIDTLLNQSDRALYQAKQTGRNKVCIQQD